MSAIRKVLDRVMGVKQTKPGSWIAKCPSHADSSPSLSIREMEDGRVLINCFAGCPNGEVLAAIGLRMSDLFDKAIAHHLPPVKAGFTARELLELIAHETSVAAIIFTDAEGRIVTAAEAQRLRFAAARIGRAQDLANGH